eukprot:6478851-Amphidinium_carterae.1
MHYTVMASGEDYVAFLKASRAEEEETDGSLEQGIRTPHNIQVLAVLRFFGYGDALNSMSSHLQNQLVQVRTGEGKSLILGSAATLFALLGFSVRCVCYSAHLSSRDACAFARTFDDFRVTNKIKYSQITTYSEDSAAAKGDIRALTLQLLTNSSALRPSQAKPAAGVSTPLHGVVSASSSAASPAVQPEAATTAVQPSGAVTSSASSGAGGVLLIDEVDVLWGPDFHGKTHNQLAKWRHPSVRAVLEALWDRRQEAKAQEGCRILRSKIKQGPEYTQLQSALNGFEYVLESQVDMMVTDLHDFLQEVPPLPEFDTCEGGRIGYKILDGIDYNVVHGYRTAFAYLQHRDKLQDRDAKLNRALALLVPCGQFAYSNFKPRYIFGVSGTVEQLEDYQRQEVHKHRLQTYTTMPS